MADKHTQSSKLPVAKLILGTSVLVTAVIVLMAVAVLVSIAMSGLQFG